MDTECVETFPKNPDSCMFSGTFESPIGKSNNGLMRIRGTLQLLLSGFAHRNRAEVIRKYYPRPAQSLYARLALVSRVGRDSGRWRIGRPGHRKWQCLEGFSVRDIGLIVRSQGDIEQSDTNLLLFHKKQVPSCALSKSKLPALILKRLRLVSKFFQPVPAVFRPRKRTA
jgi:hypothetical protein